MTALLLKLSAQPGAPGEMEATAFTCLVLTHVNSFLKGECYLNGVEHQRPPATPPPHPSACCLTPPTPGHANPSASPEVCYITSHE